jgi:PAS domain S-box-containing protein
MKSTHLTVARAARTPGAARRVRSVVLRYGLAAVSFALVIAASFWLGRAFSIKLDPTFVILLIMIASAWYLGLGPGLLIAVMFEAAINYFGKPPHTLAAAVVVFNRTLLFASVVWFASSRRKAEGRLRRQSEWLRVTLSSIGDAVIATDVNGSINFINPTAEAITGWTTSQAAGRPLDEVFRILRGGTREPVEGAFSIIKRGHSVGGGMDHTVLLTKDGGDVPIEVSGAPTRDSDGKIIGVIIVFHDVSERRAVEVEREHLLHMERAARAEVETALRLKDEFLATVSHELRTPLTAILGWSSILNQLDITDEEVRRSALQSIERNAKMQARIVDDVLDVARVITGKLHVESRPVELTPIISAAVETIRPAASAKAITLTTSLDADAGVVAGDPDRLQQIFWNLISNAIKFTPERGRVEVRLARVGEYVEVTVGDTGMGISEQFLPHVFERFRQSDSSRTRAHGGLGLGLAIVRHLVELHGGTVSAESGGEGRGSEFTVRLPRAGGAELESVRDSGSRRALEAGHAAAGASDLTGLRVLVVDDEPDTLEFLRAGLSRYGAQVCAASSSADAYEAVLRWKPDLIVSDLGMPGEDGFALIEKVRALPPAQGGNTPAAALTAYVGEEDRTRAVDAGYQAHIPKPVDPATLAALVAGLAKRG